MQRKDFQDKIIPLSNKAYRLAYRFVEDKQEAEDVVQDVFLKLWKMRGELLSVENLESFTVSMVKRTCIDKIRHENVKRKHSSVIQESANGKTDEKADEKEMFNEVKKVIERLPESQKVIVTLKDIEGFSYDEIAEITGLTINNLRVSLSRIRKSIKEVVKKKFAYGLKRDQ